MAKRNLKWALRTTLAVVIVALVFTGFYWLLLLYVSPTNPAERARVIGAVVALAGVLAGALMTGTANFFLNSVTDKRRFRHDDQAKARETLTRVYANFWGSVKAVELFPDAPLTEEWQRTLSTSRVELEMFAPPTTQAIAYELFDIVVKIRTADSKGEREKLLLELVSQEDRFRQAVKADMGIRLD